MADDPPPAGFDLSELASRGHRLRLDAATAEVFGRFEHARVNAVLLKGRSLSDWLYEAHEVRPQADCDLLIPPSDLVRAEEILTSLGFERDWDDTGMPSWWREHAGEWRRQRDDAVLDVHRTLAGARVDPNQSWEVLSRNPAMITVAGRQLPALDIPARALHVALHAAHHGVGPTRPLEDLKRALRTADEGVWRAAAELAAELAAIDGFTMGLQLDPRGTALAKRLDLPARPSTRAILHASSPPPVALGFEQLASAEGARAKLAVVTRKLVPPTEFIRHWDPRAENSRRALVQAYLWRPLWLLARAPRGLRAWNRARGGSGRN